MKKMLILMLGIFLLTLVSAEQVLWDNDSNITIIDSWKDIDGIPLSSATCSYVLYNSDNTRNQSGIADNSQAGRVNLTLIKLPTINTYSFLLNCTKSGYNGTSTKDSIKIVDELPEGYQTRLVSIQNDTTPTAIRSYQIDLGINALTDLRNRAGNNTFGLLWSNGLMTGDDFFRINSTEAQSGRPFLLLQKGCVPPSSSNWEISINCEVIGENVIIGNNWNVSITSLGNLTLLSGSNVTFTGSNQYINIWRGGIVNICKGCNFPA